MLTGQILEEVITLPEGSVLAEKMGYALDRSNLLRYARAGRLVARKSQGTWLTTRAALQALIIELASESKGRPRSAPGLGIEKETPAWAEVHLAPDIVASLTDIDILRDELTNQKHSPAYRERLRRELTTEAIYHTNRIEGNLLSLSEVRALVEALWADQHERQPVLHESSASYESTPA